MVMEWGWFMAVVLPLYFVFRSKYWSTGISFQDDWLSPRWVDWELKIGAQRQQWKKKT